MRKQVLDTSSTLIKDLIKTLASSRVAMAGSVISGVVLPVLVISAILDMKGGAENPYFGFLIYMVMGPIFMAGLATAVIGVLFFKDKEAIGLFTLEYIKDQLSMPGRFTRVRKLIYLSSFLMALTTLVVLVVSVSGYKYTETVSFCGQFCHVVMEPEYITHQNSPHSRVSCVECHIDENAGLFTKAKVSGIKQIFSTLFNSFDRPLKTPIKSLRPNRNVCEKCHRPEMFHGAKLYLKDSYLPDEKNTVVRTVLLMKVGSGGYRTGAAQGIHWHVSPNHHVYFQSSDDGDSITKVKLIDHDGSEIIFSSTGDYTSPKGPASEDFRLMDCLDCHNRPTHIFLAPEEAIDQKMIEGLISSELPFIKRQAVEALRLEYSSQTEALKAIAVRIESWYRDNEPRVYQLQWEQLSRAIAGIGRAYSENVFPEMNVDWGTYGSTLGHRQGGGCFRCHEGNHRTEAGRVIPNGCDLCHVVLADHEKDPAIMNLLYGDKGVK